MPIQAPQWTEFLSCPICFSVFNERPHKPISLACGHTVCKSCLMQLQQKKCPFDQMAITKSVEELPVNFALLQLVGVAVPDKLDTLRLAENSQYYDSAKKIIEELAMYLKPVAEAGEESGSPSCSGNSSLLSRPMQRKLVSLVSCQLVEDEGRARAMRAARSLGERITTELILQHQNPQQLSSHLWAAVRARGCQFLGPAMQEEVLRLILLALEDGSALSRKVLVLFVVQRLETQYPQASKTAIGHVVQLLYRASCFKVTKREKESSLMQLKEELCIYEALRREHDSQVVQIATEAGLRISPEQWSSLLYGDNAHKSHMQSIIDKLQTPQSFSQSVNELVIVLQRTGDPHMLSRLRPHFDLLADVDPNPEGPGPTWESLDMALKAVHAAVLGLAEYTQARTQRKADVQPANNPKFKTSLCRDLGQKGCCPRGDACTFAHSQEELERYRLSSKRLSKPVPIIQQVSTSSSLTPQERQQLEAVTLAAETRLALLVGGNLPPANLSPPSVSPRVLQGPTPQRMDHVARETSNSSRPHDHMAIPVMKPSSLPAGSKTSIAKQTIYTSPILATQSKHEVPSVSGVPSSKKAPSLESIPPASENQLYMPNMASKAQQLAQIQKAMSRSISHTSTTPPVTSAKPPSTKETEIETVAKSSVAGGTSGVPGPCVSEATMRSTVMMPPNPYTTEKEFRFPTPDSHYYLPNCFAMATRGRSPSQHLQELHIRRNELLSQLSSSPNGSVSGGMTASVADSMATSHSTMSFNKISSPEPVLAEFPYPSSGWGLSCKELSLPPPRVSCSSFLAEDPAISVKDLSLEEYAEKPPLTKVYPPAMGVSDYPPPMPIGDYASTLPMDGLPVQGPVQDPGKMHHEYSPYQRITYNSFSSNEYVVPVKNPESSSLPWEPATGPFTVDFYTSNPGPEHDNLSFSIEYDVLRSDGGEDEFIPFGHTYVSKYGPIARMARAKTGNTVPVQVTAAQGRELRHVTSVTPVSRPYPITAEVPSRFDQHSYNQQAFLSDHIADPFGSRVATSLPTALMQPNITASINHTVEPVTLWSLKEKMVNIADRDTPPAFTAKRAEEKQIRRELECLNVQINNLKHSEDVRLVRELQSVELNIQETKRQMHLTGHGEAQPSCLARDLQAMEEARIKMPEQFSAERAKRQLQVAQDRKLAEQMVLSDALEAAKHMN